MYDFGAQGLEQLTARRAIFNMTELLRTDSPTVGCSSSTRSFVSDLVSAAVQVLHYETHDTLSVATFDQGLVGDFQRKGSDPNV